MYFYIIHTWDIANIIRVRYGTGDCIECGDDRILVWQLLLFHSMWYCQTSSWSCTVFGLFLINVIRLVNFYVAVPCIWAERVQYLTVHFSITPQNNLFLLISINYSIPSIFLFYPIRRSENADVSSRFCVLLRNKFWLLSNSFPLYVSRMCNV